MVPMIILLSASSYFSDYGAVGWQVNESRRDRGVCKKDARQERIRPGVG